MAEKIEQVDGNHYAAEYQHWDLALDLNMNSMTYAASKYLDRVWQKAPTSSAKKTVSYLKKLHSHLTENTKSIKSTNNGKEEFGFSWGAFKMFIFQPSMEDAQEYLNTYLESRQITHPQQRELIKRITLLGIFPSKVTAVQKTTMVIQELVEVIKLAEEFAKIVEQWEDEQINSRLFGQSPAITQIVEACSSCSSCTNSECDNAGAADGNYVNQDR